MLMQHPAGAQAYNTYTFNSALMHVVDMPLL
jgi:hypothetical protein